MGMKWETLKIYILFMMWNSIQKKEIVVSVNVSITIATWDWKWFSLKLVCLQ